MSYSLEERVYTQQMTRRDFLWLLSLSSAGVLAGCAVNPVTGQRQLMLVSEKQEIQADKQNSPHQFSADYGILQDQALNNYISEVGLKMAALSHRPQIPYSFQGVNATYVNAYAFPGGSIATTRGILASLKNEAELSGLLGHELGHVNARHTAARMSKGMLISTALTIGTAYINSSKKYRKYGDLAEIIGGVGASALLAHYSRSDERQADALGMEYMTKSGYSPNGMVGLMELLNSLSKHKPSVIETMFATHPMSQERYQNAKVATETTYGQLKKLPLNRDRYMDHTAKLRRMKAAIEGLQQGERAMAKEQFTKAEQQFKKALKTAPEDYTGLAMMAKCQLAMEKPGTARRYAEKANQIYPKEAQAHHLIGLADMMQKNFGSAYEAFQSYEKLLPGNPNTVFFKGMALEGMQKKSSAAKEYSRYLKMVSRGDRAEHAQKRLIDWGYLKPPKKK